MEQLSEIERAARKLMLAAKAQYDRARSANVMREEIDGMMQRAPTIPAIPAAPATP